MAKTTRERVKQDAENKAAQREPMQEVKSWETLDDMRRAVGRAFKAVQSKVSQLVVSAEKVVGPAEKAVAGAIAEMAKHGADYYNLRVLFVLSRVKGDDGKSLFPLKRLGVSRTLKNGRTVYPTSAAGVIAFILGPDTKNSEPLVKAIDQKVRRVAEDHARKEGEVIPTRAYSTEGREKRDSIQFRPAGTNTRVSLDFLNHAHVNALIGYARKEGIPGGVSQVLETWAKTLAVRKAEAEAKAKATEKAA